MNTQHHDDPYNLSLYDFLISNSIFKAPQLQQHHFGNQVGLHPEQHAPTGNPYWQIDFEAPTNPLDSQSPSAEHGLKFPPGTPLTEYGRREVPLDAPSPRASSRIPLPLTSVGPSFAQSQTDYEFGTQGEKYTLPISTNPYLDEFSCNIYAG